MGRIVGFIAFIAVVVLVLVGLHAYVWARLVRDTRLPQPWTAIATAALVALAAGLPLMRLLARRFPAVRVASWPLYTWLGVLFLFFALLLSTDIIRLAIWAWTRLRAPQQAEVDIGR